MDFIITLLNGLSLGGIYAMIALGYTMVYGIAKMLNFAHGDLIMVGGYAIYIGLSFLGHPILAIIFAIIFSIIIGIIIEKFAYKPLRGASPLAVLITAIGVSYLLQSIAQIIFGSQTTYVVIADLGTISLGGVNIQTSNIVTVLASIVVMAALSLFIKFSKTGRAMIAVSEDREAAELMGINVNNIITITFIIGAILAAVAAALTLLKSPALSPTFGSMPGIKAFTAAVIGGIGSIPGAMLGGVLLGLIECICDSIVIGGSNVLAPYKEAIEFAVLIILLLVRPTGLLGKVKREKV